MLHQTKDAIRAICAADPTVDQNLVEQGLAMISGDTQRPDEPLSPMEVANLLKCTTRTVSRYEALGKIRAMTSRKDGVQTRYSKKSVIAFMEGRAA